MIITCQKSLSDILESLSPGENIFIAGCSECATVCETGGEKEVLEIKSILEERGFKVSGWAVFDPACHMQRDKRTLRRHKKVLEETDTILALACGNGVQTLGEASGIKIISGNDTLFLGSIVSEKEFQKTCSMCGECLINDFGGLCPVTRCPKHMLNGPCGGSVDGRCEVSDTPCVWHGIFNSLERQGRLEDLKRINPPKNWSHEADFVRGSSGKHKEYEECEEYECCEGGGDTK